MTQTIKRSALVPYSAREMYSLVEDIGSYRDFLNWCSESIVESQEKSGKDDTVTASLDISYHGINRRFTTRNTHTAFSRIRMELVEGPFSELTGDWRFTPLAEKACKIELEVKFEFSNPLTRTLVAPVFGRISDGQVDAFHARAIEVYGAREIADGKIPRDEQG
jgi:ribosome-associated toxin RatA of RatAB toxin-antitoxin module